MQKHKPVLLQETIDYLNCKKNGIYLDGTLGRGGHTKAILEKISNEGFVIAIDRDKEAIKEVRERFDSYSNLKLIHGNFVNIPEILDRLHIDKVEGMVFDLGVSSPQIDNPERGFSYQHDGPLDMRMNRDQKLTAADIVNNYSYKEISEIIKKYGEERWATRIAEFIVDFRDREKITSTKQLVEIIKNAIPAGARRSGGHPAKRTFQALRIAINNELHILEEMIKNVVSRLKSEGRICIISFHSLEDRIVKHTFRELAKDCVCPPDFPICVCDHTPDLKVFRENPIYPEEEETKNNPRARSAKLRVAEKLAQEKVGEKNDT